MRTSKITFRWLMVLLPAVNLFTGCESTDSGSVSSSTTVYYGAAFYDPWYYGDYDHDHDHDVIVSPPPSGGGDRPPGVGDSRPRPEHPIANPPGSSRPPSASQLPSSRPPSVSTRPSGGASARPTPSIPSAPRGGGGGRGGGGRR